MPKISVIVPVYKVEKYINRCVDSILAQTFEDYELILIDDGSPDNCGEICNQYARKDRRIVVLHQKNAGVSAARNNGIIYALNSNSSWITFIDSDDWVSPEFLQILYSSVIVTNTKISIGTVRDVKENMGFCSEKNDNSYSIVTPSEVFNENQGLIEVCWTKLYHRSIFENEEFRFPEAIRYEDTAIVHKIVFSQSKVTRCNAMYYYFIRNNSEMHSEWNPSKMMELYVSREQRLWLRNNGFHECIEQAVKADSFKLKRHLNACTSFKYRRIIRNLAREMLRTHKKELHIEIASYPVAYEVAYPIYAWVYWFVKAQLNKLHKV